MIVVTIYWGEMNKKKVIFSIKTLLLNSVMTITDVKGIPFALGNAKVNVINNPFTSVIRQNRS